MRSFSRFAMRHGAGRSSHSQSVVAQINVVPYVDVMLVLLVIFMITTPLLTQGVQVQLPQVAGKALQINREEPIIVSIDARGRYYLNIHASPDAALSSQTLQVRIAAELVRVPARTVLVKGDRGVDYGRVVQLMALLRVAGAQEVGLLTDPDAHV